MNLLIVCVMFLCILKGYLEGFELIVLYLWFLFKKVVKLFIYELVKVFNIFIRK